MAKNHNNSIFAPVGRFFGVAAASVNFARHANALVNTPDSVFEARGTTRQKAIRDLMNQL